jgi:UDP-glucose 4-epimerase
LRILITGGAGYIGSVVARMAQVEGHQVFVLDDLSTGHKKNLPNSVPFIQGGVATEARRVIRSTQFDAVMHFAASAIVYESVKDPVAYWDNNVGSALELLAACSLYRVPRVVVSSTCAVYGNKHAPISERSSEVPVNPYGATKLAVDRMLGDYSRAYGFGAASLRYFNVGGIGYGLGERHEPETHLIPNAVRAAKRGEAVPVYGTDHPTPDGTCIRDYVHVLDLARAHLLALDLAQPGRRHEVINLGSGKGYSVAEVIREAHRAYGHDGKIKIAVKPRRPGDPPRLIADISKAKRVLNWEPKFNLVNMVADAGLGA